MEITAGFPPCPSLKFQTNMAEMTPQGFGLLGSQWIQTGLGTVG